LCRADRHLTIEEGFRGPDPLRKGSGPKMASLI